MVTADAGYRDLHVWSRQMLATVIVKQALQSREALCPSGNAPKRIRGSPLPAVYTLGPTLGAPQSKFMCQDPIPTFSDTIALTVRAEAMRQLRAHSPHRGHQTRALGSEKNNSFGTLLSQ
jgi:hypothetical protein